MPLMKDPVKIERNCWRIYGCSLEDALRLNADQPLRLARSPAMLYAYQRTAAAKRGIEWCLTFPKWMEIWERSGKFSARGIGKNGYCMGRCGDVGPYADWNVYICTNPQNITDGFIKTPGSVRVAKMAANPASAVRLVGSGRGWTLLTKNTKKPYQVMVGKKYIGLYASPEEAEAAYRQAIEVRKCA